jgi:hypothetical protein
MQTQEIITASTERSRTTHKMIGRDSSLWGGLLLIAVMFVVDPIYSYLRRRFDSGYPRYAPPRRLFRFLAFALPAGLGLAGVLVSVGREGPEGYFLWIVPFGIGCYVGRFFYNRAHDQIAHLPTVSVYPDDPELENDLWDLVMLALAVVLLLMPVYFALQQ